MALLERAALVQVKAESSYGVEPTIAGSDAMLARSLTVTPLESDTVSRDLIRSWLGNSEQLLALTRVSVEMEVEIAGSGTGGTASRIDSLLKACGMASTVTSSAVTGSSQAGSSGSITLASGANATDDYYNGMQITITSGTGNTHKGLIVDYVGSTKVATVKPITATFVPGASSGYSIAANVGYVPVSSNFASVAIQYNLDGIEHKILGARGSYSLSLAVGEVPSITFSMTGLYTEPTDTTADTAAYSLQATPVLFKQGNTVASSFAGYDGAAIQSFSVDMANEVIARELVGADKSVILTNRQPTGEAVIETPTIAAKNFFSQATSDTTGLVSMQHGTTAGNIVSILCPTVDITNPSYSSSDGISMLNIPFTPVPNTGNDEIKLVFS
ncbi:MAG: hypothetical protein CMF29_05390 [Kiritimatiellaceae bacterium]|nr:hypothetical protein [Kiritimatiellaceae bacterium]|tara:strand:+ start:3810 stop:4970 length:1161 start_codon:yes stop_codon:yes gene_type:complete